jgi:hypothetical protein
MYAQRPNGIRRRTPGTPSTVTAPPPPAAPMQPPGEPAQALGYRLIRLRPHPRLVEETRSGKRRNTDIVVDRTPLSRWLLVYVPVAALVFAGCGPVQTPAVGRPRPYCTSWGNCS